MASDQSKTAPNLMNRRSLLGLAAAATAAAVAAPFQGALPALGSARPPAGGFAEGLVWAHGENGVQLHHVFGLAVTNADTVLAFTEARIDAPDTGAHHLVYKRSTDGGATWSPTAYIEQSAGGQSWTNPAPVVDRSTNEIFFFYALNDGTNTSTRVFYRSSVDDGVTFGDRVEITSMFAGNPAGWTFHMPGPGHGLQLDGGRLILQVWHRKAVSLPVDQRTYGVSVIYSDDHGAGWHLGGTIPVDPAYPVNESRLLQRDDGAIVMNGRYATSGTHSRISSVSTDGGASWSGPVLDKSVPAYSAVDSGFARFTGGPSSGDRNRVLFSRPDDPSARVNMTVSVSYDEGYSYPYSRVVYTGPSYYSDLARLSDGTILLLYGKDAYSTSFPDTVAMARFTIDWLTGGADSLKSGPGFTEHRYECEAMTINASGGAAGGVVGDANASSGALLKYLATGAGDFVELRFDLPASGTYQVYARWKQAADRATVQASIDGADTGAAFDPYAGTAEAYTEYPLGSHTFTAAGGHLIRFTATGKNAASTGYGIFPDYVRLVAPRKHRGAAGRHHHHPHHRGHSSR
ncbi:hypothetical protein F8568_025220 [Actinomadura sp. LD22]|uniref:exo-alpha-sialidase n=1 Tax=Actinomadura physcomitrii TaxID=2650748 RepID=A0A6I4MN17_9ACTN|nr:exo-alpha-sialidase [Actinomadura physcomitrii]MWA03626.1 hypothetical protein [Actinomadura physcomitrii]